MPPLVAKAEVRSPRKNALLGTMIAGIIALILIALALGIISNLGERRLALLPAPPISMAAMPHPIRATPGLLAPLPLATRAPLQMERDLHAPSKPSLPVLPPNDGVAIVRPPVEPPEPAKAPQPAASQFQQFVTVLPFTRIHDAFLWRPYVETNPKQLKHSVGTEELEGIRRAGRLTPDAVRFLIEQRRPMQTLAQLHAQARMLRTTSPATQPSR
jgi:hypothetical protein